MCDVCADCRHIKAVNRYSWCNASLVRCARYWRLNVSLSCLAVAPVFPEWDETFWPVLMKLQISRASLLYYCLSTYLDGIKSRLSRRSLHSLIHKNDIWQISQRVLMNSSPLKSLVSASLTLPVLQTAEIADNKSIVSSYNYISKMLHKWTGDMPFGFSKTTNYGHTYKLNKIWDVQGDS